jgi:hypothetical protein
MEIKNTCRIPESVDDALNQIVVSKKITKNKAMNEIIQLGLEAYFKKTKTDEDMKTEKKLLSKFSEIQEKIEFLSVQVKGVDLKSYRMNVFITDFAEAFFDDNDKFKNLTDGTRREVEKFKIQEKQMPKLGSVVLEYMQNILNKNLPDQFYSEIEAIYSGMNNKK